nr:unnamed protein product [Callosobruchus chinensis]
MSVQGGGDIPTIFNPGGGRQRTPSVVVTEEGGVGVANGPFGHADSIGSQPESSGGGATATAGGDGIMTTPPATPAPGTFAGKMKSCSTSVCSRSARKIYFGIWVTVCVTASWVGATHCIKYLYLGRPRDPETDADPLLLPRGVNEINMTAIHSVYTVSYQAPFFTTWFVTNWTMLFFPLYYLTRLSNRRCESIFEILSESIRDFRDKGFTAVRFMTRCSLFCILWVGTNYMYIMSLRILPATDVMALFATNVSFVYLLSWVILHEQFVGIRVALFFSLIGMLNAAFLWPLCLGLFLIGTESLHWETLPWPALLAASCLSLVANLLGNFSVALTYDLFITLGLITAVPVSAALDVVLYDASFEGMKLAGMILIAVGFFLVMFPDNWPDYITRLLRNIILLSHSASMPTPNYRGKKRELMYVCVVGCVALLMLYKIR